MVIKLWVSTDEVAKWISENTIIKNMEFSICKLVESDASNQKEFHRVPESIKRILYYDAVDIIIEFNNKPLLAVEITHEAGTGHNAFQRFARIIAAAENNVPVAYIYPEAAFIHRKKSDRWDKINPNIFKALERVMQIHNIPTLLYYYPTEFDGDVYKVPSSSKGLINDPTYLSSPDHNDSEMLAFFQFVNDVIKNAIEHESILLLNKRSVVNRREWMQTEYNQKRNGKKLWSPDTATITIPTSVLLKHLNKYTENNHDFGNLLNSREYTVIYKVNAKLRGDPYPGALSALDYIKTRIGEKIEDRDKNLVLAWTNVELNSEENDLIVHDGKSSINDFMESVNKVRDNNKCLLSLNNFNDLNNKSKSYMISRYFMQVNHGCNYTKKKEIRVYAAFADAIIFKDGALWKEG